MRWMLIALLVLLVICAIGIRLGMATEEFKIKRRYVFSFLLITELFVIFGTIYSVLFNPRSLFTLIASFVVFGLDIVFLCVTLEDKYKLTSILFYSLLSVLIVPCIVDIGCTQVNTYNHTLICDYKISIVENEVIAEYDRNLVGVEDIINNTVANMKKYGSTYYEGSVEVEYNCMYPPFKNLHESYCRCTDKEICDACREHSFIESIKESNSN